MGTAVPSAVPSAASVPRSPAPAGREQPTAAHELNGADSAYARSEYAAALAGYARAKREPTTRLQAQLGVARVQLMTGDYKAAAAAYEAFSSATVDRQAEAALIRADALRRTGNPVEAEGFLRELSQRNPSRALRVAHCETLLALGRRGECEAVLSPVLNDYNEERIPSEAGRELAMVARAAYLLRSPEEANDTFNEAEQTLTQDSQVLLWRAELFLERYDPGHAEEVVSEVLRIAPNHPEALVWMAEVKLAQSFDFAEARRLAERALLVNPALTRAYFVLAGIALRDMLLDEATAYVQRGLALNPEDLELLSMQASVRFLADDHSGFAETREHVFKLNAEYSRFYQVVGEYAEWEHRYEDIVSMMSAATQIDDDDARAHAQLGLNLIRSGNDRAGLTSLRRSFAKDPFNVRVFNTLNLYEEVVAKHYVDVPGKRFNLRYSKEERTILERYVPALLDDAWERFERYYQFQPATPVGVELYAERESFAIRTSGLPQTAIQGVCFGRTVASMSPRREQFNLGMTLWHELAHVFHIQLSKNHVPRWFTEGLAEYETLVERPEWKREQDVELYDALRNKRLPKVSGMNEAFTHAEDLGDVTVAYYASTQIVRMLAENYGRGKLREMLLLWGEGKRSEQVFQIALGLSSEQLDAQFADELKRRLSRYDGQFIPVQRTGNPDRVRKRVRSEPRNADAHARLALLALQSGDDEAAGAAVAEALKLSRDLPDALWLSAQLALRQENHSLARSLAERLVQLGKDGYETQLVLARSALMAKDGSSQEEALLRAHALDPSQAEALHGLLTLARSNNDKGGIEKSLVGLSRLEEHNGGVFQELMDFLLHSGRAKEAVSVGSAAVFADMEGVGTHVTFAKVLAAAGENTRAEFQFESALASPGEGSDKANAHLGYAEFLKATGRAARAEEHVELARALAATAARPSR
ncbi:MAG: hypothetical protein RJA70_26 [Pseudomonadota bacterium]|jgi:Tfp pilus assembly protein PilF